MFSKHVKFALECHGGTASVDDLLLDFAPDALDAGISVLEMIGDVCCLGDAVVLDDVHDRPTQECEPYLAVLSA